MPRLIRPPIVALALLAPLTLALAACGSDGGPTVTTTTTTTTTALPVR